MKTVSVIDDDQDILTIMKFYLQMHGVNVQTHSTGYNVPQIISNCNPDLVLLDIDLPGKSGLEICKEIKLKSTMPVILFSANWDKVKSLKECNANAFISKPFKGSYMLDIINLHLN